MFLQTDRFTASFILYDGLENLNILPWIIHLLLLPLAIFLFSCHNIWFTPSQTHTNIIPVIALSHNSLVAILLFLIYAFSVMFLFQVGRGAVYCFAFACVAEKQNKLSMTNGLWQIMWFKTTFEVQGTTYAVPFNHLRPCVLSNRVGGSQWLLVIQRETGCHYAFVLNLRSHRVCEMSISVWVCFGWFGAMD